MLITSAIGQLLPVPDAIADNRVRTNAFLVGQQYIIQNAHMSETGAHSPDSIDLAINVEEVTVSPGGTYQFTATGGTGNYTWESISLPSGVPLSASGLLSAELGAVIDGGVVAVRAVDSNSSFRKIGLKLVEGPPISVDLVANTRSTGVAIVELPTHPQIPSSVTYTLGTPTQGTVSLDGNQVTFNAPADFTGVATVQYTLFNDGVSSGTSTITFPAPFIPDPNKIYHIESAALDLRLAADGESEQPYLTTRDVQNDDTLWMFVESPTEGLWHIQRVAGGTTPRFRADSSNAIDMHDTVNQTVLTRWAINVNPSNLDTYLLTLPETTLNRQRLSINSLDTVELVSNNETGLDASLRIVEVTLEGNDIVATTSSIGTAVVSLPTNPQDPSSVTYTLGTPTQGTVSLDGNQVSFNDPEDFTGVATVEYTLFVDGVSTRTSTITFPAPFIPDPNSLYYIESAALDVRLASDGESEQPYATSKDVENDDTLWRFIESPTPGLWHIERAAGGSIPRLRTDNESLIDMGVSTSTGNFTQWAINVNPSNLDTYLLTLSQTTLSHQRLRLRETAGADFAVSTATSSNVSLRIVEAITGENPYTIWAQEQGLTASDLATDGDADGDGVPNLLEFVLNGNPNTDDARVILPSLLLIESFDEVFTYRRRADSTEFTTQTFEISDDLITWAEVPVAESVSEVYILADDVDPENPDEPLMEEIIFDLSPFEGATGKIFVRLKVEEQ